MSISRQKRFIRRFKKLLLAVLLIIAIAGLLILVDALRQGARDDSETGTPVTSVVRPSIREFDTDYFTFTAPTNWMFVSTESSAHKFVYRSYRNQLVEQEFTVYVNDPTADLSATYALPVRIDDQNRIIPTQVSDHCSTVSPVKAAHAPVPVTIMDTTINCQLDGTNYIVAVGLKGGDTAIKMRRGTGSMATLNFIYRSSTTPPDTLQLVDILNSFVVI